MYLAHIYIFISILIGEYTTKIYLNDLKKYLLSKNNMLTTIIFLADWHGNKT